MTGLKKSFTFKDVVALVLMAITYTIVSQCRGVMAEVHRYHGGYQADFIIVNKGRTKNVIQFIEDVNARDCGTSCVENVACVSFNFNYDIKLCELVGVHFDKGHADILSPGWWNYDTPRRVNGKWAEWSNICGTPCSGGYRRRYRLCNNPPPRFGGLNCLSRDGNRRGVKEEEPIECGKTECPETTSQPKTSVSKNATSTTATTKIKRTTNGEPKATDKKSTLRTDEPKTTEATASIRTRSATSSPKEVETTKEGGRTDKPKTTEATRSIRTKSVTSSPTEVETTKEGGPAIDYYKGDDGYYYKYHNKALDWSTAKAKCESEGAQLTVIANDTSFKYLQHQIQQIDRVVWLGAFDLNQTKNFTWVDGQKLVGNYWRKGQPDNYQGVQSDCVMTKKEWGGRIGDAACQYEFTFLCQKISTVLYTSLGCWKETGVRAITTLEGTDSRLDVHYRSRKDAIRKCYEAADARGFSYFALQDGGWCASSNNAGERYMMYGKSSKCSGGKGGPWANDVYIIIKAPTCVQTEEGSCCVFPFTYEGKTYHTCKLSTDGYKWCAITDNYVMGGKWSKCISKGTDKPKPTGATPSTTTESATSSPKEAETTKEGGRTNKATKAAVTKEEKALCKTATTTEEMKNTQFTSALLLKKQGVQNFNKCKTLCVKNDYCFAWTYFPGGKKGCHLKKKGYGTAKNSQCSSGRKLC